jgi:molybdopterin synthase catalytic subunit
MARERAGRSVVEVELPESARVVDLKAALAGAFPSMAGVLSGARIAVDSEYADDDHPIRPGADLAVIPPVSGG